MSYLKDAILAVAGAILFVAIAYAAIVLALIVGASN